LESGTRVSHYILGGYYYLYFNYISNNKFSGPYILSEVKIEELAKV